MNVEVPYGSSVLTVAVDEGVSVEIVHSSDVPGSDEDSEIARALDAPLDSPSLGEFLRGAGEVLFIVNDAARPTPTARILEHLAPAMSNVEPRFIVATGAHRAPTDAELDHILGGAFVLRAGDVMIHDARDSEACVFVGRTTRGTDVRLNSAVTDATRVIIVGSIEPHYFAGYTGGRKSILPGVSALTTIEQNHAHALSPGSLPLALKGNPVHEDMAEALELLGDKPIFSIQTVLDRRDRIHFASAGAVTASFETARPRADEIYSVEVEAPADIVVAVATPPLDGDFYQGQKAVEHGRLVLKDGGTLILVSECREGMGASEYTRLMRGAASPTEILDRMSSDYRLGDHKAAKYADLMSRSGLWAVTSLPSGLLSELLVRPIDSLQRAIDEAVSDASLRRASRRPSALENGAPGPGDPVRVVFLMTAATTVPRVTNPTV